MGWNEIHEVAASGSSEDFKRLRRKEGYEKGCLEFTEQEPGFGDTPIMTAARNRNYDVMELLYSYSDTGIVNNNGDMLRDILARNNLLDQGVGESAAEKEVERIKKYDQKITKAADYFVQEGKKLREKENKKWNKRLQRMTSWAESDAEKSRKQENDEGSSRCFGRC